MKDDQTKWTNLNTSSCDVRMVTLPEQYTLQLKAECDSILGSDHHVMLKSVTSNKLEYTTPAITNLSKIIMRAGSDYLQNFLSGIGIPEDMKPKPHALKLTDLWLNCYMAGDYSPAHRHMKKYESGLSFFLWLEFPLEEVKREQATQTLKKNYRKGDVDGHTVLMWRSDSHNDCLKQFTYPGYVNLNPTPGTFVIFPSWLTHLVYPLRIKERQVSIAGNLEVIWAHETIE